MRGILIFLLATLSLSLEASFSDAVVKTRSARCSGGNALSGSGTLFWLNGKPYVLSSDHVILHGNREFCHFIKIPKLKKEFKAKFLASEWGLGLALLQVDDFNETSIGVPFAELKPQLDLKVGDKVFSYGYPLSTEELTIDTWGSVADTGAEKPFYVILRKLIHITGTSVEFGMSGGACISPGFNSSDFVGVLSHQKLDPAGSSNELFVIPAKVAVEWLERYFQSPENFKIYFFEHPEGQLVPAYTMILTKNFIFQPFTDGKGFAIGLRHIPEHCEVHEYLFEKGFNLEVYRDQKGYLEKFTKYVEALKHDGDEASASIRIFRKKEGALQDIPMGYFSEFFLALNEPDLVARTRVSLFHDARADALRNWAKEYDRRVSEAQLLLTSSSPLAEEFFKAVKELGDVLKTVPMFPEVPPGSLVAKEFFTYEWLWARKAQLGNILKNEKFTPLWKELEVKGFAKKKALEDMFRGVDQHLFVDEV